MSRQGAEIQGLVDKWIKKTADKSNVLQQYESVRCRKNVVDLWEKLIIGLEIEEKIEEYAIRITEKVSEKDVKLTYNLILKYSSNLCRLLTLCLILAEKVSDDSHHTLGDFSLLSGFRMKELASLEVSILFLLEFKIVLAMDSTHWFKFIVLLSKMLEFSKSFSLCIIFNIYFSHLKQML